MNDPTRVRLLEQRLDLTRAVYLKPSLLRRRLALLEPNRLVVFVQSLSELLVRVGRKDDAARLLDTFVEDGRWLDPTPATMSGALMRTQLAQEWFERFGTLHGSRALALCRRVVAFLRTHVHRLDRKPDDRLRFIDQVSDLRQHLLRVAHFRLGQEADPKAAEALSAEILCWDAELGQRRVLERLLNGRTVPYLPSEERPISFRELTYPRREPAEETEMAGVLGCFELRDTPPPGPLPATPSGAGAGEELERLRETLAGGIDESHLAEVLDRKEVMLRISFDIEGQIIWSAWRAEHGTLQLLVQHRPRPWFDPVPCDRDWLHDMVEEHARMNRTLWQRYRTWRWLAPREAERRWTAIANRVRTIRDLLITRQDLVDLPAWSEDLAERLAASGCGDFATRLQEEFLGFIGPSPIARQVEAWLRFEEWLERTRRPIARKELELALNRATRAFLDGIETVLDLRPLLPFLNEDVHLVVLTDDALNHVPYPYLRVGGRELCRRVASCRTGLTPLLMALQRRRERQAMDSTCDVPPRVLSLSHFSSPDDPARHGADQMHRAQEELAQRHGHEWFYLSDLEGCPRGSRSGLARGLAEHQAYRTALICAHGFDCERMFAQLHDGLWDGSGMELEHCEFLVLLVCAIGNLRQTLSMDKQGFCVESQLHGARSILAGRWTLHSTEAPRFVTKVVDLYLELRRQLPEGRLPSDEFLRAQAVNRTRLHFLDHPEEVSLNTAAAFELYGLG